MGAVGQIHTIGICGLGQMGAAAAVCFKRGGYRILAWDQDPDQLSRLPETVVKLERWLDQNGSPPLNPGGSIEPIDSPQAIDVQADLVMDCIDEDLDEKSALFRNFNALKKSGGLFITTTSGLSITEIGRRSGTGPVITGTHFWNPPHLMPLVEVIRGEDTLDEVFEAIVSLIASIGKLTVKVNKDVPGFIGNRMLHALWREAIDLVEKGIADPEDVDTVARLTFGLRLPVLGPLENMDLVGLDLIERIHSYLLAHIADSHRPSPLLKKLAQTGQLGFKSGQGFYDWGLRDPQALIERRDRQILRQLAHIAAEEDMIQSGQDSTGG